MPIVVNSNTTATIASFNLSHANDSLRKSLARLSSGKRIVQPSDDAGGMAVAYKLNSKLKCSKWHFLSASPRWCTFNCC